MEQRSRILSLDETNSKHYLYLFIVWPFLAFLVAIANYGKKEARMVVYFFLIYYGLTFVNTSEGVDAYRYILMLQDNTRLPFTDFFKVVVDGIPGPRWIFLNHWFLSLFRDLPASMGSILRYGRPSSAIFIPDQSIWYMIVTN